MICRERLEGEGRGRDRLGREHRVGSDFPGLEAAHRWEDQGPLLSCPCVGPDATHLVHVVRLERLRAFRSSRLAAQPTGAGPPWNRFALFVGCQSARILAWTDASIGLDTGRLLLSLSASTACSVVKRKSGHRRARFRACCPQVPWLAWTVELDSVNNVCVGEAIGQGALIPCDGGSEAPRSPARRRRHARPVRYSLSNYLPEPADRCSTTRTAIPESIPD
jgi:hypothetical protein